MDKFIYHKDDMPRLLRYIFSFTEYISYFVAALVIIYSVIISIINLQYYIKSNGKQIALLYKIRLITGQLLNISLTLILGGLIVRLLHITNIKTLLLIVITITLKELIMINIDKESSFVSQKIKENPKI